jgi:hypothetical protein
MIGEMVLALNFDIRISSQGVSERTVCATFPSGIPQLFHRSTGPSS